MVKVQFFLSLCTSCCMIQGFIFNLITDISSLQTTLTFFATWSAGQFFLSLCIIYCMIQGFIFNLITDMVKGQFFLSLCIIYCMIQGFIFNLIRDISFLKITLTFFATWSRVSSSSPCVPAAV
uniref:Uncharacterized protein n=1 Tax=Cacopsylla melanoneura TaxID=428564 RepID=A0A8D8VA70_9HEMI